MMRDNGPFLRELHLSMLSGAQLAVPAPAQPSTVLEKTLADEWADSERLVKAAGDAKLLPYSAVLFAPHALILSGFLKQQLDRLHDPEVVAGCLSLIEAMKAEPAAQLYGFDILIKTLVATGNIAAATEVANEEISFLTELGVRGFGASAQRSHPATHTDPPRDYVPDGPPSPAPDVSSAPAEAPGDPDWE